MGGEELLGREGDRWGGGGGRLGGGEQGVGSHSYCGSTSMSTPESN